MQSQVIPFRSIGLDFTPTLSLNNSIPIAHLPTSLESANRSVRFEHALSGLKILNPHSTQANPSA
jgi:hypothetical protein